MTEWLDGVSVVVLDRSRTEQVGLLLYRLMSGCVGEGRWMHGPPLALAYDCPSSTASIKAQAPHNKVVRWRWHDAPGTCAYHIETRICTGRA